MQQNYIIFIKNRPLRINYDSQARNTILVESDNREAEVGIDWEADALTEEMDNLLQKLVDKLLKGAIEHLNFTTDNTLMLLNFIADCFDRNIDAAGGTVFNKRKELLCIFRLGYWDLPKGKVEPGEELPEAALREVHEETGLKHLKIRMDVKEDGKLCETHHVYVQDKKTVFKTTHWYVMDTTDEKLVPQTEEDITKAEWISRQHIDTIYQNTYENIKFVLTEAMAL